MISVLSQVAISLIVAYSLLSVVVARTNEYLRALLARFSAELSRSGFLATELTKVLIQFGDEQFVKSILKNPLVNVLDKDGKLNKATEYVEAAHLAQVILQSTAGTTLDTSKFPDPLKTVMNNAIANIQDQQKKIEAAEQAVQDWLEKQFTKMSQTFRNQQYWWSFVIGLVFALFLNIDTIQMVQVFWKDPTVRAAVVQAAGNVKSSQQAGQPSGEDPDVVTARKSAETALDSLQNADLPIWWVGAPTTTADTNAYLVFETGRDPRVLSDVFGHSDMILSKLLGVLLTGFAASRGSDFWFNLLRNLTQRSS